MSLDTDERAFTPGTTGWTAADLDDPRIERLWELGQYEIIEGVLTTMPPAYLDSSRAFTRFVRAIQRHLEDHNIPGEFAFEADYIVGPVRVARSDVIFMTPEDDERQAAAHAARPSRRNLKYGRLLVPPTLIIESVSLGHEGHDRELKRRWYAEAGVPNYWIFDAFERRVEALVLDKTAYRVEQIARNDQAFEPSIFRVLSIKLNELWA